MIRLATILLGLFLILQPASSSPLDNYHWAQLNGPFVMTYYGTQGDGYINRHHGAYWNGLICPDANNPSQPFPDHVTSNHFGVAMPGASYYCLPVKICYNGKCVVATAIDTMGSHRLQKDEANYSHIDIWYAVAQEFDFESKGIQWGQVEVYVGAAK